ncbi:tripartite tricarboxylate transporter substrate-binding protein [Pseudaquabacterium rugosum]|uniref:Tripartite tricarboxylate transporter substrate-binding protein n=1 Tax=Pseudaquabacterium rugosum TaxID=2984194 RepID=A0ABU9BEI8_9BURK
MPDRRRWLQQAGALACPVPLLASPKAHALDAPATARLLIGAPAGGAGDALLRRIADKLRGGYAPAVIVENKAGAAGQIALMAARDAAPDGATLLMSPSTFFSVYPHAYARLPYDPQADFMPVSLLAHTNFALVVGPKVPESVRTLADFMAWSRAHPDEATFGSPATGSVPHLVVACAAHQFKAPLRHVPYRGSVPGLQDLRGGQIAAMSSPIGAVLSHLVPGGARALAVTGAARSPLLPQVPTWREQGLPLVGREWFGMFLPARVPQAVATRTAAYLKLALQQSDLIDGGARLGLEVAASTPQELQAMIAADSAEWRVWIRRIGFSAEAT